MTGPVLDKTAAVYAAPVGILRPNPLNPRTDIGDVADLVSSIRQRGIMQPLITTSDGPHLLIIAGHRRLAAAREAGLQSVPVIVVGHRESDELLLMALSENLHRAPMPPMDEARACQALLDMGLSRADVANEVGRSNAWVSARLVLLELPVDLQKQVDTGAMPLGKGVQLGYQVRRTGGGSVTLGARVPFHFIASHPLAAAARTSCDQAGHVHDGRIGLACGGCWERTIRADERGETLNGWTASPDVDDVAVDRAVGGDRSVHLSKDERAETIRRLAAQGRSDAQIGQVLGMTKDAVLKVRHRTLRLAAS